MTNMEKMIDNLYEAQDNNEIVTLSYFINGGGFCVDVTVVPDVMVIGNWIEITDKLNHNVNISFSLDKYVGFDPETEEYSIEMDDAVIVISS